ncbi:MAG: SGNH/GDSL hydrolase family protein [Lachnospiraceae bacterium]|nr:SGNH/GDSL hydrolase family protein [Lachnospiraceae bacterium]
MKHKNFIKIAAFLCIFLFLLQTVTYIIRTNGLVKDRFTGFYGEKNNTLDVVMIGSSPVFPCFAGAKMYGSHGFTAYPLSSNMQRPMAALSLVKETEKTQHPKLYLFELKQFTANEEDMADNMAYTRGVTDNMKYSWNRIDAINRAVPEVGERYTYYFDIFKYHSNWKTMVLPSQIACWRYERLEPLKGFEFKADYYPMEQLDCSQVTDMKPIEADYEGYLRELLQYLQDHDMQALFTVAPYVYESADKQRNYNYMQRIVESYGYQFLNLNDYTEEMGFDYATDFYDKGVHTNAIGAEKVTDFLGAYLDQHYDLPDHRLSSTAQQSLDQRQLEQAEKDHENYKSWDQAYERWSQQMEESRAGLQEKIAAGAYLDQKAQD